MPCNTGREIRLFQQNHIDKTRLQAQCLWAHHNATGVYRNLIGGHRHLYQKDSTYGLAEYQRLQAGIKLKEPPASNRIL